MIMAFGYVEAQTSYVPYYTKTIDALQAEALQRHPAHVSGENARMKQKMK